MKNNKRIFSLLLVFVMVFQIVTPTIINAQENNSYIKFDNNVDKEIQEETLVEFFTILMDTPDEILESLSEEELMEYFNQKSEKIEFRDKNDQIVNGSNDRNGATTFGWWENTKCGAAVVLAVGGGFFAGTQLLKFKKYIKAIGGVKDAGYLVYLYITERTLPPNSGASVWSGIKNIAAMIFGLDLIKEECGHLF